MESIDRRRSIRKFKDKPVSDADIRSIIEAAVMAPSAKNRQPWKFIVYRREAKKQFVDIMRNAVQEEAKSHALMPEWSCGIPDALNTIRVMDEASVLIAVLNTNSKNPFIEIKGESRIEEICDSLSIGAAIENLILEATDLGLGTLWIANTCFAYDALVQFIHTKDQLVGTVAVGYADESPEKRPRKNMDDVFEYR